jgi:4-coumarate--CoA ligase (photoactive yellow protein activation family)
MRGLLDRHRADAVICFGAPGARSAAQLCAFVDAITAQLPSAAISARPSAATRGSVVLACRDRYYFMAGLLAALRAGLPVMLPPNGQPETVRALLRDVELAAFFRDDEGEGIDVRALERPEHSAASLAAPDFEPDRALLSLYTSGSTGTPQGHTKSVGQLLREAQTHVRDFALAGRRFVAGVPPQHIYGLLWSVLAPLTGGGSVLRQTPLFPGELCAELRRHGADVLISVPPQLIALSEDPSIELPGSWRIFCSAGPLPIEANAALQARGASVTEILGSTETGGIAFRDRPGAPYRPLTGVEISVDESSILHVDVPWLGDDEPRPYRTADRAALCPEGFRHLGRADAVTKIAGRRVDLGDVESVLLRVPGVRAARVLAVDAGGLRGLTLWAIVEADGVSVETLRDALKARFDPVTLPKRYRVVAKLPRSEQGKLRRSDLLSLFDAWELTFEALPDGGARVIVPRDLGFLRGHFEGDPLLPAVVQLRYIALAQTRQRFPELGTLARITAVQLGRAVRAGEALELSLTRPTPSQVQFSLRVGEEPTCSGLFHFREAAPP